MSIASPPAAFDSGNPVRIMVESLATPLPHLPDEPDNSQESRVNELGVAAYNRKINLGLKKAIEILAMNGNCLTGI